MFQTIQEEKKYDSSLDPFFKLNRKINIILLQFLITILFIPYTGSKYER